MSTSKKLPYRPPIATRVIRTKEDTIRQTVNYSTGGDPCSCA
jgi:hypothetical protein